MSGGVNAGDSPLDLPPEVMAGAINTTVSGKNATHRPPYYNRPVTYVDVAGQICNVIWNRLRHAGRIARIVSADDAKHRRRIARVLCERTDLIKR